jgi:outer membrane protein assembly factor BamB
VISRIYISILAVSVLMLPQTMTSAQESHWPGFRGLYASGVQDGCGAPTAWDVASASNVKWKRKIPGLGHSCPVVWGDRVFVTTAVDEKSDSLLKVGLYGNIAPVTGEGKHAWKLYCINRLSGDVLWEKTAHTGHPIMKRHTKSSHANSTPATDGKRVVAFFASEGLFCYSVTGEFIWKKDLGALDSSYYRKPKAQWGFASSPVIYKGIVIIQCDVMKNSFIAAFNLATGDEVWRTGRSDVPTWSTPTVYTHDGKTRIVVNGYKHTGGYDFKTGKEVWRLNGGGDIPVPTPVLAHGLIFIANAHGKLAPIYAIKTDAVGDISLKDKATSNEYVAWSYRRGGAYMITPIAYGEYFYNCRNNGSLRCYNARTGEQLYRERLGETGDGFTASPVAADGKLYFTSEEGDVYVVEAGPEFKVLAKNAMDDICMASPALAPGMIIYRTRHYLMALSN